MKTRIMYIESKGGGLIGPARIGRVAFSKTGATIFYAGRSFQSLKGAGFKSNYFDVETGDRYWISGPKKNGQDSLYATHVRPVVDPDVHDEYWREIRGLPVPSRPVDGANPSPQWAGLPPAQRQRLVARSHPEIRAFVAPVAK